MYDRSGGDSFRGRIWDEEPGIYIASIDGKQDPRLLTRSGGTPRFSKDGNRVYLVGWEGDGAALISYNLLGSDRRVIAKSKYAVDYRLSPDENWLAFEELWQSYVIPFPKSPMPLSVQASMKSLPVKQLSEHAGTYLGWTHDSKQVTWSLGPELFSEFVDSLYVVEEKDDDDDGDDSNDEDAEEDEKDEAVQAIANIGWTETDDLPATDIYFVGGRILPMHDMSIIENGVVHVVNNKIAEVGPAGSINIPANAQIIDVTGMTVLPGFVDVHAHVWSSNSGIYAQQSWSLLANLAFGVTTIHDPSNNTQMIFAASERVRKGMLIGPRIFSTGTILYGADGSFKTVINKYEDAVSAIKRTAAWGAFSVKSYNQPRRNQRQMVIKAALADSIMVVPEGGSTLHHNMTQLLDGHTTLEHNIPVAPLYEPELNLLSRFGSGYTPTLVVSYGGLSGEKYWYQHTKVYENKRLAAFTPRSVYEPKSVRRDMAPDREYHHITIAQTAAEVVRRGGNVQMGSHGQMQGLAAHWEIWMFEQGGMTSHQALRVATWMGARAIGLDGQLGSIQSGLLADLIVIDGDPLADIRQSENIKYTMINGRLYDAMTMNQIAPTALKLPEGPFTDEVINAGEGFGCCQERH